MEIAYKRFHAELLKSIKKRYSEGNPSAIKNDTKKLSQQFMIDFSVADSERKNIEKKVMNEWIQARTSINKDKSPEGKILNSSGDNSFATMAGKLNRDVKRVVDRGLRNSLSMAEIETLIKRAGNLGGHQSRTITRTAKMGKIRADYLIKSIKAGAKYFKITGPVGDSRDFCKKHVNKIYSIENLIKLDNKQGLPVLIYIGGYNCRHGYLAIWGEYENGVFVDNQWSLKLQNPKHPKDANNLKIEKDVAEKLAALGNDVELNPAFENLRRGASDLVFNGERGEIKTPKSKAGTIETAIKGKDGFEKRQSDLYIVNLKESITEIEKLRLIGKIKVLRRDVPVLKVYIFHNYLKLPYLEEL